MAEKLAQDVAELSGINKGLTEVVKQQASDQNTTSKHIDDLAKQIKNVSEVSSTCYFKSWTSKSLDIYPKFNYPSSKVKFLTIQTDS